MYTDLYSLYKKNTTRTGFWFTKKNWENHVGQVLKIRGIEEGEDIKSPTKPEVVVMLMDKRTKKITEIVEIAEPQSPDFQKLHKDFKPKYEVPQSMMNLHNSLKKKR